MNLSTLCLWAAVAATLVLSANAGLSDCDPLDTRACYLPMPNDFWLRDNGSGAKRLSFSKKFFPVDNNGKPISPDGGWNNMDGWPAITPIMTFLPNVDLSVSQVATYADPSRSLVRRSPTTLLQATTLTREAHWAELDSSSGDSNEHDRVFMMWPARRLKDGTRYIVAIHGVVDSRGQPLPPSEAFRALRDKVPTTDPDVEERRAHFEDIFAKLEAAGVARSSLQLAWDFTTGSRESITGPLVHVRDDAWRQVKSQRGSLQFRIRSVQDNPNSNIARIVEASVEVPQYVDKQEPGARLVLGADGLPVFQKFVMADFTIQIPRVLVDNPKSVRPSVMQYGHGLFGRRAEANSGYLQKMANDYGSVIIAGDWIGLSQEDEIPTALMLMDDLSNFGMLPDRTIQGMLRALCMMRLFTEGNILKDQALMFNGRTILTPDAPKYYYGNSQGGILGSVYMAVSQDVQRGCLGVGGAPYVMLLPRSVDFTVLWELLKFRYSDSIDRISLLSMIQILWDRAEPSGFTHLMTTETLPNTPPHEVLFQHALGDAQVTQLGLYIQGRSLNAQMFTSNVREPTDVHYGFDMIPDTATGKTAVVQSYRFQGVPPIPIENVPPPQEFDPHGWVRKWPPAIEQMWIFFQTGQIKNTCGGPCDNIPPTF